MPTIIAHYNEGMGGTDNFDQKISYYRSTLKSVKWQKKIYSHFITCSLINAHILYKEDNKLTRKDKCYSLIDSFRVNLN